MTKKQNDEYNDYFQEYLKKNPAENGGQLLERHLNCKHQFEQEQKIKNPLTEKEKNLLETMRWW